MQGANPCPQLRALEGRRRRGGDWLAEYQERENRRIGEKGPCPAVDASPIGIERNLLDVGGRGSINPTKEPCEVDFWNPRTSLPLPAGDRIIKHKNMTAPINTQTRVDCITSSGKTYCEKTDLTKHDIVIISSILLAVILWFGFFSWLSMGPLERHGNLVILASFVIPLIGAIICFSI
jgi:hypothetical protein